MVVDENAVKWCCMLVVVEVHGWVSMVWTDLGAFPGQMSVIPEGTAVVGKVIIQTFGAMDVGMLMLLAFLICREHHFWILSLSLHTRLIHKLVVGEW